MLSLFSYYLSLVGASLVAHLVKNMPAEQETWVWPLGWKDPLEKEMGSHSSILAWKISWQRGLVGCSLWDRKESGMTEQLIFSLSHIFFGDVYVFLIGLFLLLLSCRSSLHILILPLNRYIFENISSHSVGSFYILLVFFAQKILILMKSMYFCYLCFCCHTWEILPNPVSQDLPFFFSKLYSFSSYVWSFWVNFCIWYYIRSNFMFLHEGKLWPTQITY